MFNKAVLVSRILLGLAFVIFGINGLMFVTMGNGFIPAPPPSEAMMPVMTGFMATKYLMPLVKILEIVAGLLLLCGCYTNLALVILAPIMVNIIGIHLFVDMSGLPVAIIFTILYLIVFKSRSGSFKALLCDKN